MNKNIIFILLLIFILAFTQTTADVAAANLNSQIADLTIAKPINTNTVIIQSDLN